MVKSLDPDQTEPSVQSDLVYTVCSDLSAWIFWVDILIADKSFYIDPYKKYFACFSYPSIQTYVLGAQKKCLLELVEK